VILWTWKEHLETRGDDARVWPCKAFRWALIASGSVEGMTVEIAHQHQRRDTGEWGTSHTSAYGISLNRG
jgi:hypothetical protein